MVGKFEGVATYFHDLADRHLEGVASGRTPADFAVRQTTEQLDRWLATPIEKDQMLDVQDPPAGVDAERWRERLLEVVQKQVRPAVEHYRDVLRDEVSAKARPDERCGLDAPAGRRGGPTPDSRGSITTTDRFAAGDPRDRAGAGGVAREGVRRARPGGRRHRRLPSSSPRCATTRSSHHTNGDEIVADSKTAMAKARAAMGDWFGRLPKSDCDVEATTSGAIAYYFAPPKDGRRGGVFFMNVSDPEGWGRYEIENTSLPRGHPGTSPAAGDLGRAGRRTGVPEAAFIAAYGEGWGLYTERLADEMGLYSSPLDRVGMLSADSMRACRLVVDTGMHALGWSRQQAVDYMLANSPMRAGHIGAEIDRYAVTPGQALSYMIGRLEIQRIRREAEARQGGSFDIKAFHDAVLGLRPDAARPARRPRRAPPRVATRWSG